jgi:hypothetical protein
VNLEYFKTNFYPALKVFFESFNIPINYLDDKPIPAKAVLSKTFKAHNEAYKLIDDVYFLGSVDDKIFEGQTTDIDLLKSTDYKGLLIFGVTLHPRGNGLLPTRTQMSEITRAFNKEFNFNPVAVVFRYDKYISLAASERLKYKVDWREGDKPGKVSILRDVDILNPHAGHLQILKELHIDRTGKNGINNFKELYEYWQQVFSTSILNKKFYQELQTWYIWALKDTVFPGEPKKLDNETTSEYITRVSPERGKNIIRLLTRILFVWFIKEKKLIPEEFFDEQCLSKELLNELTPEKPEGLLALNYKNKNASSYYYKAILQNLFFATLNQEVDKRDFRKEGQHQNTTNLMRYRSYFKSGGDIKFIELMRANVPFMNGGLFECLDKPDPIEKGPKGGSKIIYKDGFSDRKDSVLCVPDYLFFDHDEEIDVRSYMGSKSEKDRHTKTKGLISILKSYKFTVAENTPVEEDVALDPELLGKIFENLLASYNPETKTTARKQTGSFYTPREIVDYMVDESLISYLKTSVKWDEDEETVTKKLHQLFSYSESNPFITNQKKQVEIINALDKCKILDPACGSGAFPMGALQKMVHVLNKVDPDNSVWKETQLQKAGKEEDEITCSIDKKEDMQPYLDDIHEAFDKDINDPDYSRKLYLIENCIYGVDIQDVATQISKLRFFISLVIEQKTNKEKENFGIRPLPNLEMKFVTANTLVNIDNQEKIHEWFQDEYIGEIVLKLKKIRHKIFSLKTPKRKEKWRAEDKETREELARLVEAKLNTEIESVIEGNSKTKPVKVKIEYYLGLQEKQGNNFGYQKKLDENQKILEDFRNNYLLKNHEFAQKLAYWDPYNQNKSASFFDPEWMFNVPDGFDIVIGNPPYIKEYTDKRAFACIKAKKYYQGKMDLWYYFACTGIDLLSNRGLLCFIATNNWTTSAGSSILRNKVISESKMIQLIDFGSYMIFESAAIQTMILLTRKSELGNYQLDYRKIDRSGADLEDVNKLLGKKDGDYIYEQIEIAPSDWVDKNLNFENKHIESILNKIKDKANFSLDAKTEVAQGIVSPQDFLNKSNQQKLGAKHETGDGIFNLSNQELANLSILEKEQELLKPFYTSSELDRYWGNNNNVYWVIYTNSSFKNKNTIRPYPNIKKHLDRFQDVITSDNKPYGLHRARNEFFFKGEKIISLRKCAKPTFTYTDFDCYVSQTYFVIKTERINQKYLTAILNSKLIAFWLWHRGKLQGDFYQIDKEPILNIPIIKNDYFNNVIITLIDTILFAKSSGATTSVIENIIDALVFNLYFSDYMVEREIDVIQFVENDLTKTLQDKDLKNMNDNEKEQVIAKLHETWTDPNNEVVKRMSQFREKSPDILKVILDN